MADSDIVHDVPNVLDTLYGFEAIALHVDPESRNVMREAIGLARELVELDPVTVVAKLQALRRLAKEGEAVFAKVLEHI
jgi:hypothetical protein